MMSPQNHQALLRRDQHALTNRPHDASGARGKPAELLDLDGTLVTESGTTGGSSAGLLDGFRRRRWLALGLGLLSAVFGTAAGWFLFQPQYTAFSELRIKGYEPRILPSMEETLTRPDFDIYKRTQRELVVSRPVIGAAMREADIALWPAVQAQVDRVGWLQKQLRVDFPGDAEIMRISMSGSEPSPLKATVEAVTQAYMREVVEHERNARLQQLASLEKVFLDTEQKLREQRSSLRDLANSLGTGDAEAMSVKQQNALQHFADLRREQTKLRFELMRSQIELSAAEAIENRDAAEEPDDAVDEMLLKRPELVLLAEKIGVLEEQYAQAAAIAADQESAVLQGFRRDLEASKRALESRLASLRPAAREQLARKRQTENVSDVASLQRQVTVLTQQEKQLQEDVDRLSQEAESLGKTSIEVEMARSEMERVEKLADQLGAEIESLRVELRSPARVSLLQSAEVPMALDHKTHYAATGASGILAFALAVFGVSWFESRSPRVNTANDVSTSLGLPVLGALPMLPYRSRNLQSHASARPTYWRSVLRESLDSIRTMLLSGGQHQPSQVILITSAMGGEGKTTLATQLATSFARTGRNTLLLDFDLRRGVAHHAFGLPLGQGLSELIRGEVDIDSAQQSTSQDNLTLISAGNCDSAAIAGLANTAMMADLFRQLRDQFELIVVDCCPILPVADGMLIGQHVDAAVLSVLRDVTQMPALQAAHQRLSILGIRVLGAVVTGSRDAVYANSEYAVL